MMRFDSKALYEALDQRRDSKGMTWKQVADQIGVGAATITRSRLGGRMEVDGVLAMVGWLGCTVESFTRDSRR